jgi:hypothetical protein
MFQVAKSARALVSARRAIIMSAALITLASGAANGFGERAWWFSGRAVLQLLES